jgi:hypothetical protein
MATTTISSAAATSLGDSGTGRRCTKVIQLTSSSFSGTITVKGRRSGSSATPVPIPYKSRYVNGAVGTEAYVTTAITNTSTIEVNASGLDIILDTTAAYTSGSMAVDYVDLTD